MTTPSAGAMIRRKLSLAAYRIASDEEMILIVGTADTPVKAYRLHERPRTAVKTARW